MARVLNRPRGRAVAPPMIVVKHLAKFSWKIHENIFWWCIKITDKLSKAKDRAEEFWMGQHRMMGRRFTLKWCGLCTVQYSTVQYSTVRWYHWVLGSLGDVRKWTLNWMLTPSAAAKLPCSRLSVSCSHSPPADRGAGGGWRGRGCGDWTELLIHVSVLVCLHLGQSQHSVLAFPDNKIVILQIDNFGIKVSKTSHFEAFILYTVMNQKSCEKWA